MALGSRRRQQPATTANFLHNVLALVGLGTTNDADAEAVTMLADRISFTDLLLDDADDTQQESEWFPCADRSLLRLIAEYATFTTPGIETRELIVAFRGHDGLVVYSPILEADNQGLSVTGDLVTAGWFKGIGGGLSAIDCRGMKDYKVIVLAKPGGTHITVLGGTG